MAQDLLDGEFWLPPEFLNDEDILNDFHHNSRNPTAKHYSPYTPNSDLSSPVESVKGSTESESDEEDYLAGLTRKLAHTTLQEDFWKSDANFNFENHHYKATGNMAGSPQSTLCGCKQSSSRGSPNCSSPPATAAPPSRQEPSWDLLYAAAGEVARMRMAEEAASRYYAQSRNYQPIKSHYQQLQAAQFEQLKQQQIKKQREQQQFQQMIQQNRARNGGGNNRPSALPLSAWPTLQQSQSQSQTQPHGSGMRAIFLGNPNPKRESTGTGVFLPRQIGTPTEPRRKRGCSTVLLPDRVVQALNLNLDAMEAQSKLQSRYNGGHPTQDSDGEMMYRNNVVMGQQRRNNQRQQAAMTEVRLPQEWTY